MNIKNQIIHCLIAKMARSGRHGQARLARTKKRGRAKPGETTS